MDVDLIDPDARRMSDMELKLQRGFELLNRAKGDVDLLGVALLALHNAAAHYLDDELLTRDDLSPEDHEALLNGPLGWLPRADMALAAGLIDPNKRTILLKANEVRQSFAHGEPMQWGEAELHDYAQFVANLCGRSDLGYSVAEPAVSRQRTATRPSISTLPTDSAERRPTMNDYQSREPREPREPQPRTQRDFQTRTMERRGRRASPMNALSGLADRFQGNGTGLSLSNPLVVYGAMGVVGLILVLLLLSALLGGGSNSTASTNGAGADTVNVARNTVPTQPEAEAPAQPAPQAAPRTVKLINIGTADGRLHERPAFNSPTLSQPLKDGDEVEVLGRERTDEAGNKWQLVAYGDIVGWSPVNNLELNP